MSVNVDFDELKKEFDKKFVRRMYYENKKDNDVFWRSTIEGTEWDEDMNLKHLTSEDEIHDVFAFITNALNQQRGIAWDDGYQCGFFKLDIKKAKKEFLTKLEGKKMEHKHRYTLQSTQYQYPVGMSGTAMAIEYAYLMCERCFDVIKKEVKLPIPNEGEKL